MADTDIPYDPAKIEEEIQSYWKENETFSVTEDPKKEIYLYINSPGGLVTAGLGIYDTMQYVKPEISTICIGQAASMGSFLLANFLRYWFNF